VKQSRRIITGRRGAASVSSAHDICDRIEQALRKEVEQTLITIHVEPDKKAKHTAVAVL
jgi:divalent metal cation (Fe/Co/Zn/Cd) transporter